MRQGETVVFLDEVGFSLKTSVRRTWGRIGVTPIVKTRANWSRLSTIGAISSSGRFLQWTHEGSIKAPQVVAFFEHLLAHLPGPVTVVLDNAGIHKARQVRDFMAGQDRLALVFLPSYAPELNPIEWVWAFVKGSVLRNYCATELRALRAKLKRAWRDVRLTNMPQRCVARLFELVSPLVPPRL